MNMNLGDIRVMLNLASRGNNKGDIFLQVRVVEAKSLKAMDTSGLSDPYCVIYIADDEGQKINSAGEFRTQTVYGTLSPFWNAFFAVGMNSTLRVDDYTLVIEVWDRDKWTSDDQIGSVSVPLWNIPHRWEYEPPVDIWMPLHPGKSWMKTEVEALVKVVTENERVAAICQYAQRRTVATIDATLLKLGQKWRDNVTNDYYMPNLVATGIGGFVERIWIELQLQIMQIVKGVLNVHTLDKYEDAAIHNNVVACGCCNRFTAWYRYHVEPFDKTFWGKIRDPVFVGITVLNLIPYLGFQTVLFAIKVSKAERV